MIRSWAYNRFGVLMGTSSRASCPRWPSLRGNSWPMITLFSSQGDFCATAKKGLVPEWLVTEPQIVALSRKSTVVPIRLGHDDIPVALTPKFVFDEDGVV